MSSFQLSSKIVHQNIWHPKLEAFLHTLEDYETKIEHHRVTLYVPSNEIENVLSFLMVTFGKLDSSVNILPLQ